MKKNTKKITLDQWTMIGKYNHAAKWLRKACTYTVRPSVALRWDVHPCVRGTGCVVYVGWWTQGVRTA